MVTRLPKFEEEIEPADVDLEHDSSNIKAGSNPGCFSQADVLTPTTSELGIETPFENPLNMLCRVIRNGSRRLRL